MESGGNGQYGADHGAQQSRLYEGGGINSYGSHLQLTDVNLVDNVATGTHGGLYHGGGTAFVTNATISGNRASDPTANGGGVYQNADDNLVMTNVTLVNNYAGALGGGFYHYGRYAILTNLTIADNTAGVAGDALDEDSPMTAEHPGVIQLVNSVLLGSANNCDGGLFQSLGYNISRGSCAALNAVTDRENYAGSLLLDPLAFNGGLFPCKRACPQQAARSSTPPTLYPAPAMINVAAPASACATSARWSTRRPFSARSICRQSCASEQVDY